MIKAVCMDDANRPNDIPIEEWIERGKTYTIIKVINNLKKGRVGRVSQCLVLKEVHISNSKYAGYNVHRFRPISYGEALTESLEEQINKEITIGELEYNEQAIQI
jgi:hypothetical protein